MTRISWSCTLSIFNAVQFLSLRVLGAILLVAASGCYTPTYKPTLPESLGNEGVMVGQITDVGALKGFVQGVTLSNGKEIKITHGYFAENLAPGSYVVKELYTKTYEGANMNYIRRYPLNLPFTIREKQVTNLGVVVLLPVSSTPEKQVFSVSRVDNSKDIPLFFRKFYPQLAASLALDQVTLAEGTFLDTAKLNMLRRHIVAESYDVKKLRGEAADGFQMVAGDLGTFARVRYDASKNKISDIDLQDVGTFVNLGSGNADPVWKRRVVMTEDQRLFSTENGRFMERTLPTDNLRSPSIYPVGDKGLVVADTECDVYVSLDNGASWTKHPEMKRDKCDGYGASYSAATGAKGYYIYLINHSYFMHMMPSHPAVLYYSPYGQQELHTVLLPSDVTGIQDVKEHADKLYVKSNRWHKKPVSEGGKNDLTDAYFVRGLKGDSWKPLHLPTTGCGKLSFSDAEGNVLRVRCGNDEYESKNMGEDWKPLR